MSERVLLHVLVLDGDIDKRAACQQLALGPVIGLHPVSTIAEADALLATRQIDVALVDWQLGHSSPEGLAWLGRLRLHDPDCFRVVTTTLADPAAAIAAVNGGLIDAFLAWPWDDAQAVALIHQGAEACLLRRHNRALLLELSDRNSELLAFTDNLESLVAERTARLQEANERLLQQQQALVRLETQGVVSHLARGLAHELNNPLAVILGYTQRLQRSATADDDTQRRLATILAEVDRCRALVDQLRRLAAPLEEDTIDLDPGAALAAVLDVRRKAGQPAPLLRLHGTVPPVVAAPAALRRVLGEVVANAVTAGAQHLDLSGTIEHERVALHLANDGVTPTVDEAAHATKPFFTTHAADGARGLGLAVAAGLLRDQQGHLELQPLARGGALAVIYLPRGAALPQVAEASATASAASATVLVVDDDALIGELLSDVLHELGLHVLVARTCSEARTAVTGHRPETGLLAVLADLHLPDGSGSQLLDELERDPALAGRCALITGDELPQDGIRPMLAKPFRVEQVGILLLRLLGQKPVV